MPLKLAINGTAGRMGGRLVALATADPELDLVAGLERADHPALGEDVGVLAGIGPVGMALSRNLPDAVDVVIDFSTPEGTRDIVRQCVERRLPLVLATTGLDAEQTKVVEQAAEAIPLLWAPNMSLAVNLVMKLAGIAAEALRRQGGAVDVEIIERHHRFKEDAPSGTALKFGQIIAAAMGQSRHVHGRSGRPGQRPADEIAYHALRVGDNPGEHTIVFGMLGETIELAVRATNRDCYAQGALAAAKFLAGKAPGRYGMNDVLGL